jgi:beta-lysine 5,6-aminomutase alpha subunit
MTNHLLVLDHQLIQTLSASAQKVAQDVDELVKGKTTVSIERTIARLVSIDGVDKINAIPLPNMIVDSLVRKDALQKGLAYWLGNAILHTGKDPQTLAEMVACAEIDLTDLPIHEPRRIQEAIIPLCRAGLEKITRQRSRREQRLQTFGIAPPPLLYVIVGTGSVEEDVTHALASASYGADIISVIRSTAQSLLDYIPYGATYEGYGGTYATQENFRILRAELDAWSDEHRRYVRLSNFCSGLCMPELAAIGALEGLDNMVNDALYGILYRHINPLRTFIDQKFSRMINSFAGITINTGEDNYLRMVDAAQAFPSVVCSHMVNYHLARLAGMPDEQIALGNAFEVNPDVPNGFLLEWANALLTRELFPQCKTKYMPPTRYMDGNIFRTHAADTLFNLISIATRQDIHLVGMMTEGLVNPYIQDRILSLENVRQVFNSAAMLYDELIPKPGGIIQSTANNILHQAAILMETIEQNGLFRAIEQGVFGGIRRSMEGGAGKEGVFSTDGFYFNPLADLIQNEKPGVKYESP